MMFNVFVFLSTDKWKAMKKNKNERMEESTTTTKKEEQTQRT